MARRGRGRYPPEYKEQIGPLKKRVHLDRSRSAQMDATLSVSCQ